MWKSKADRFSTLRNTEGTQPANRLQNGQAYTLQGSGRVRGWKGLESFKTSLEKAHQDRVQGKTLQNATSRTHNHNAYVHDNTGTSYG